MPFSPVATVPAFSVVLWCCLPTSVVYKIPEESPSVFLEIIPTFNVSDNLLSKNVFGLGGWAAFARGSSWAGSGEAVEEGQP